MSFSFYSQFIMWIYDRWLGGMIWAPLIVWSLLEGRRKTNGAYSLYSFYCSWIQRRPSASVSLCFSLVLCVFLRIGGNGQIAGPGKFSEIIFFYLISGFLAALLSLDVFVDTLPRMEGCKSLPFVWDWKIFLFGHVCGADALRHSSDNQYSQSDRR
ncbi:MAG: hypothetical protein ACLT38_09480 [Akkermansia sp.]